MGAYFFRYNRRSPSSILLIAVLVAWSFIITAHAQTDTSTLPSGGEEQVRAALDDLGMVYGKPVTNVAEAKAICNTEKYIDDCAEIGKKRNLYKPDELKQVNALLEEIKGSIAKTLENCVTDECVLGVAQELANRVVKKNPALASRLDLTQQKVNEQKQIVKAAGEIGVDIKACREMDPDTAPVEMLRACTKLTRDPSVGRYISAEVRNGADAIDKTAELRDALASGGLSCGDNTLEGCGSYCLNPVVESRSQGVSAIPPVCRQIAEKYFGTDGIKSLETAYTGVGQVTEYYKKQSTDIVFTTLDGRILTNPADIGRYMEEQGRNGNVEAIEKGMDFMVARGFVKPEEKEFALSMVQKFKDQGGLADFDACSKDPKQCAQYIPQEYKGEFDVLQKIQAITEKELGFDPRECQFKDCVFGIKRALPQIEALRSDSPTVKKIIEDMKSGIRQAEARPQFETAVQQGGGPGGCKSESECSAYCSDPAHSPECLAFGAKYKVFQGEDVVKKYQEYRDYMQGGQPGVAVFSASTSAPFPGQGPYPGFQPGAVPPPGQYPGFTQPGPGLTSPPGFSGSGPGPECFAAIQSGDFAKAQTVCYVSQSCPAVSIQPCPEGQRVESLRDARGCAVYNSCVSSGQVPAPAPASPAVCPALPTVDTCPVGSRKTLSFSSPACGEYYTCVPEGSPFPPSPGGGQACDSALIALLGSGCHYMYNDLSGNQIFCDGPMSRSARRGDSAAQSGCQSSGGGPSVSPAGQREQFWNSLGLRSWIRSDADTARVEQLKQACTSVPASSNVWLPQAGNSASVDFGMPDPAKCQLATSCSSGQYWNGTACSTSGAGTGGYSSTCEQYGSGWHSMDSSGNCFSPDMTQYKTTNGTLYLCSTTPANGCSGSSSTTVPSCQSGQYWNGSLCVNSTTPPGSTSEDTRLACTDGIDNDGDGQIDIRDSGCAGFITGGSICLTGQVWNGSSCVSSGGSGSGSETNCSSNQYWDGTTCAAVGTCPLGQYWTGYTCATGASGATYCPSGYYWTGSTCAVFYSGATSCPSGQTWNGSSCVSSTSGTSGMSSCASGQYWNGTSCVTSTSGTSGGTSGTTAPAGQREQFWNSLGLRSWIRSDADTARVEQLKQACTSVPASSNVWLPQAGNSASVDFGMPDPAKCQLATSCSSGQYWNGTACSTSGAGTGGYSSTCEQYGSGWHSMDSSGNCFSPTMNEYKTPAGTLNYCSSAFVPGCSSGGASTPSCPSGQYWNGSACVNSGSGYTSTCEQYGSGWHTMGSDGNCFSPDMTQYKTTNGTLYSCSATPTSGCSTGSASSCPSGQYWNGSACVSSTTTSCTSGQYWNGSACVTTSVTDCTSGQYWNGTSCVSGTSCPSGQYWNGSLCASSSGGYSSDPATACGQAGGTWDSATSYCSMPGTSSLSPNYFLSSAIEVLDNLVGFLKSLLR